MYRCTKQVQEEVGNVAVLVNNAGIVAGKKVMESEDESIERTFAVNTLAHFWVRANTVCNYYSRGVARVSF